MNYNENDEVIEKINDADAEEIPPTPVVTMEDTNETDFKDTYAGDANSYAQEDRSSSANNQSAYNNAGASSGPSTGNTYANGYGSSMNDPDLGEEHTAFVLGIISMVAGILSVVCCCSTTFSLALAIASIVCGILSTKKGFSGKGFSIAGIVCAAIAITLGIASLSFGALAGRLDVYKDVMDQIEGMSL